MVVRLFSGTKNASSWAMRAWLALREADVAFDEVVVDIRRPQRFHNLAMIGRRSPPAQVPVLEVDGRTVSDSVAIMEFANDVCGGRLLPPDALDRAEARALVAWQHGGLSGICARISFESAFYPGRRALSGEEQEETRRLCAWLEALLGRSGGPYLFGAVSLADLALAPTVVRLSRHSVDLDDWPRTSRWFDTMLENRHVREWLDVADRLPHIWYDDYLLPGRPLEPMQQVSVGAEGFVSA